MVHGAMQPSVPVINQFYKLTKPYRFHALKGSWNIKIRRNTVQSQCSVTVLFMYQLQKVGIIRVSARSTFCPYTTSSTWIIENLTIHFGSWPVDKTFVKKTGPCSAIYIVATRNHNLLSYDMVNKAFVVHFILRIKTNDHSRLRRKRYKFPNPN